MARKNNSKYPIVRVDQKLLRVIEKIENNEPIDPIDEYGLTTFIIYERIWKKQFLDVCNRAEKGIKKVIDDKTNPVLEGAYPDMRLHLVTDERQVIDENVDYDLVMKKMRSLTKEQLLQLIDPKRIPTKVLLQYFGKKIIEEITSKKLRKELRTEYYDQSTDKWKRFATNTKFFKKIKEKLLSW